MPILKYEIVDGKMVTLDGKVITGRQPNGIHSGKPAEARTDSKVLIKRQLSSTEEPSERSDDEPFFHMDYDPSLDVVSNGSPPKLRSIAAPYLDFTMVDGQMVTSEGIIRDAVPNRVTGDELSFLMD